jgi:hypothetical protein
MSFPSLSSCRPEESSKEFISRAEEQRREVQGEHMYIEDAASFELRYTSLPLFFGTDAIQMRTLPATNSRNSDFDSLTTDRGNPRY